MGGASPELVQAVTLSDENCWTADIRIPLYKSEEKDKQSNYSVVEISNEGYGWTLPTDEAYLKSGSTEDGAPAALKKENKTYAFKVTTAKDNATDHNSLTVITNTRVGGVELALKKTWNMGAEPTEAVLRLVQYDNDGKPTALAGVTGKSGETALTTDENGEFTLAPPDNAPCEQSVIFALPKYDEKGTLLRYGMEELAVMVDGERKDFDGGRVELGEMKLILSSATAEYTVSTDETKEPDRMAADITNTLSGAGQLIVNKVWHDVGESTEDRPDITLALYRRVKDKPDTEEQLNTGYRWDLEKNKWFWQCTFTGRSFERFDTQGYEYEYYAVETLVTHNSGYAIAYYNGMEQPDIGGTSAKEVFQPLGGTDAYARAAFVKQGTEEPVGAPGTVINTPQEERSLSGEKIWASLPDGYDRSRLPEIAIMLFCAGADENDSEHACDRDHAAKYPDGNKVSPVVLGDGSTSFAWNSLPKYDEYGGLLYYYAAEVEASDGEGRYKKLDNLPAYNIHSVENGSVHIENRYTGGGELEITVKKHWDWRANIAGTQYPDVTFTLFRSDDGGTTWEEADKLTLKGGDIDGKTKLEETAKFPTDPNKKLHTHAPNNNEYIYRVEETHINGYETTYSDANGEGIVTVEKAPNGKSKGSVEITNTYQHETNTLKFRKVWKDEDNRFNTRPTESEMDFELYYSFKGEHKEVNINSYNMAVFDDWTIYINGKFIMHDTDGTPYLYYIVEKYIGDKAEHYEKIYTTEKCQPGGTVITNTLKTATLSVNKLWQDEKGAEFTAQELRDLKRLGKLPDNVTFGVEYLDSADWKAFPDKDGKQLTQTWTIEELISAVENNNYLKFTARLPMYDKNDKEYTYRAVEQVPQGATFSAEQGATDEKNGSFVTHITNRFGGAKQRLHIYKLWHDANDTDGQRPNELSVLAEERVDGAKTGKYVNLTLKPERTNDFNFWYGSITVLIDNPKIDYEVTEVKPDAYRHVLTTDKDPKSIVWDKAATGVTALSDIIPTAGQNALVTPDTGDRSYTLMNTHEPYTVSAAGVKSWQGDDNRSKETRPEKVQLQLMRSTDGKNWDIVGDPVTLTAAEKWTHTWMDLPVNKAKDKASEPTVTYTYKAEELTHDKRYDSVNPAPQKAVQGKDQTHTVINALKTTALKVEKQWQGGAPALLDETTVTVKLQRFIHGGLLSNGTWEDVTDNSGKLATLELSKGSDWSGVFKNLPLCDEKGNKYSYRAVEISTEPWFEAGESVITDDVCVLTNTLVRELTIDNITPNPVTKETNVGGYVMVRGDKPQLDVSGPINNGTAVIWGNDRYWLHTGEISVKYFDFGAEQCVRLTCTADDISPLKKKFPDAAINSAVEGDTRVYTLTLANAAEGMPYKTLVEVGFRPTLAVENTTPLDRFGTVMIEKKDAAYDGRYSAVTVKGYAESGYAVDFRHLQLGLPGSVSRGWAVNNSAVGIDVGYYGGRFSVTVRAELAGKTQSVPVTGTVVIDRRDVHGNPTEITITLDSLPVPLDIGIPFTRSLAPLRPRTGDDSADMGVLLAVCALSLAVGGAAFAVLRRSRAKRRKK